MVDTSRNKERSPMGRHGGHVTKRGVLWGDMVDTLQREESYGKTWWTRCHVTKRGVLWEDMVDTWSRNKERSPMGRHGGHVVTKRGVLWEDMVDM